MAYFEKIVTKQCRLEDFLSEQFSIGFYKYRRMLSEKSIKVNGKRVTDDLSLLEGDAIGVYLKESEVRDSGSKVINSLKVEIVYEDEYCLVIMKPQGIMTNNEEQFSVKSIKRLEKTLEEVVNEVYPSARAAHRLDTNTSGLVVFAKNNIAFVEFVKAFRERRVKKTYNALAVKATNGTHDCQSPINISQGSQKRVELYLSKNSEQNIVRVSPTPKPAHALAITDIRIKETRGDIILFEINPITGRTHQIRSILSYLGYYIIGDSKYGSNIVNRKYKVKKQLLTCASLEFFFPEHSPLISLSGKVFEKKINLFEKILNNIE